MSARARRGVAPLRQVARPPAPDLRQHVLVACRGRRRLELRDERAVTIEAAQLPEASRDPQEQVQPEERDRRGTGLRTVTMARSSWLLEIRGRPARWQCRP